VFRSWSRFLAVSLQVTWVINPAVGCHYFPLGLQLPSQPLRLKEGWQQFRCLVNRRTVDVNSLPKTVSRQRHGCDLNPGPSAPESSTLTTRLPSRPVIMYQRRRGVRRGKLGTQSPALNFLQVGFKNCQLIIIKTVLLPAALCWWAKNNNNNNNKQICIAP